MEGEGDPLSGGVVCYLYDFCHVAVAYFSLALDHRVSGVSNCVAGGVLMHFDSTLEVGMELLGLDLLAQR